MFCLKLFSANTILITPKIFVLRLFKMVVNQVVPEWRSDINVFWSLKSIKPCEICKRMYDVN